MDHCSEFGRSENPWTQITSLDKEEEITQISKTADEPGRDGFANTEEVGHSDKVFTTLSLDEGEVVGFVEEAEKISNRLQRGSISLDIVGMPGLGKTTLAQKLHKSRTMTSYFQICLWCCVSQVYTPEEICC